MYADQLKIVLLLNTNTQLAQIADVITAQALENLHHDDQSKQLLFFMEDFRKEIENNSLSVYRVI